MVNIFLGKRKTLLSFPFTKRELFDYVIAICGLTIAFFIATSGGYMMFLFIMIGLYSLDVVLILLLISFIGVLTGFALHETAHKLTAMYYGARAKFIASYYGILFAILTSFFFVVFAAPGAVAIDPYSGRPLQRNELGKTALAGPLVNIIIGALFLLLMTLFGVSTFAWMYYVAFINIFLGLFNLTPGSPFDGGHVFLYSRKVWGVVFVAAAVSVAVLITYPILFGSALAI
jgi:Zn-dependent protease